MGYKTYKNWDYILRIWFSGYLDIVTKERRNQISPISHFAKNVKIFKEFIGNILRFFVRNNIPKNKVWFLSLSQNNYESLKELQKKVDDSIFVSFYSIKDTTSAEVYKFPLRRRVFYNLFFPIKILYGLFEKRLNTVKYYDLFFQAYGTNQECYRLIKKYSPKAIVFANDHVIIARSMLLSAKKAKIDSHYIQHASISKYFPPLDFDFAYLEGKDTLEKYKRIGKVRSKVYLTGMPKFDNYAKSINKKKKLEILGVAYNVMDNLDEIRKLVNYIKEYFPNLRLIVRAHPSDKRKINISNVSISNPRKETSFEYLLKIDGIISGNSSIHLEAVLLNVFAIQYDFVREKVLDYYGFIENKLVYHSKSLEEIKGQIALLEKQKENIQYKAKYYNAAIDSDFYGKSTDKIAQLINKTIVK